MPVADAQAMAEASRVTGASRMWLFLAAMTIVLAGATGAGFVPLSYARHGRPAAPSPIGPLWETCLTYTPDGVSERLAQWVAEFAAVNAQAPSMQGLALVDFASLDTVMELRRFTVNVRLPERPLHFGDLGVTPFDLSGVPRVAVSAARGVKSNLGIRLYPVARGHITATMHYDPDDYAGRERIFTAVCHVVRRIVTDPGMSREQAGVEALAVLQDGGE
jgi:hypothetical protein